MADDKSREVRLGLVLYGGVSLAIYINGVANEFFRIVRGNGVYKLIKALTDSEVVVDIISGTSAGGINGIFLSYALTNELDFSQTAQLWRELGDINALLRKPNADLDSFQSLLDSEVYYNDKLVEAFQKLDDHPYQCLLDDPSPISELDLLITGTDIDGNIYTIFDDAGHPIDVKDHRTVFLLKHREGRKHPFKVTEEYPNPETAHKAMAKLARITSCFPAAFAPVHVSREDQHAATANSEDVFLRLWGDIDKDTYFLDGGILDNKPFTHTIRHIFYRTADRDVERLLFYVEPDPERFDQKAIVEQPGFYKAAVEGSYGINGYESIADDLKLISEHNTRVEQFKRLCEKLRGDKIAASTNTASVVLPKNDKDPQYILYINSRRAWISDRAVRGLLRIEGKDKYLSGQQRQEATELIQSFDKLPVDEIFLLTKFDVYFRLRRLFHLTYRIRESLRDYVTFELNRSFTDTSTAQVSANGRMALRVSGVRYDFDLSKSNHLTGLCQAIKDLENQHGLRIEAVIHKADEGDYRLHLITEQECELGDVISASVAPLPMIGLGINQELRCLLRVTNWQIKLLEITRYWMEHIIDTAQIDWEDKPPQEVWRDLSWALQRLLANPEQAPVLIPANYGRQGAPHENLDEMAFDVVHKAFKERAEEVKQAFDDEHQARQQAKEKNLPYQSPARGLHSNFTSVLEQTDAYEARIFQPYLSRQADYIKNEYQRFLNLDALLYPLELLADLHEKDVIRTVRISPYDAQTGFSKRPLEDKVSGDSVAHFGGFFKKSWRANDILWGRLDALCQLVESTLKKERLEQVLSKDHLRRTIRERFFQPDGTPQPDMDLEKLFPSGGRTTLNTLSDWLKKLTAEDAVVRQAALVDFDSKVVQLIEVAQLEILHLDVPAVILDAIEEQAKWNQFRVIASEPKALRTKTIKKMVQEFKHKEDQEDDADLELCTALAGWTAYDKKLMDDCFRQSGRYDEARWSAFVDGGPGTYGELVMQQAMARSRMRYALDQGIFRPGNGLIDPLISTVASEEYAKVGLTKLKEDRDSAPAPAMTKMGLFFRNSYMVGSEHLFKHIPGLVLLEVMAGALLVLRNCILAALPESARRRIQDHLIYKFGIDRPLKAAYHVVRMWRREPISIIVTQTMITTAAMIVLLISVFWWDSILFDKAITHPQVKWLFFLFGLPVTILYVQYKYGSLLRRLLRILARFFVAALLAGVAILVVAYALGRTTLPVLLMILICSAMALFAGWLAGIKRSRL